MQSEWQGQLIFHDFFSNCMVKLSNQVRCVIYPKHQFSRTELNINLCVKDQCVPNLINLCENKHLGRTWKQRFHPSFPHHVSCVRILLVRHRNPCLTSFTDVFQREPFWKPWKQHPNTQIADGMGLWSNPGESCKANLATEASTLIAIAVSTASEQSAQFHWALVLPHLEIKAHDTQEHGEELSLTHGKAKAHTWAQIQVFLSHQILVRSLFCKELCRGQCFILDSSRHSTDTVLVESWLSCHYCV